MSKNSETSLYKDEKEFFDPVKFSYFENFLNVFLI